MRRSTDRLARIRGAGIAAAVAGVLVFAIAVPAQAADTDKPILTGGIIFAPTSVDTTRGDATSIASVPLGDASGVASATLTLTSPDGTTSDLPLDLGSGTPTNGVWTGPQTFSAAYDATGRWTPTLLTATDTAGNTATITSGLGTGLTMTRTADTTSPTLLGASATTNRVDTTTDAADVVVRVDATDDLAGVAGGRVTFTSPDGQDTVEGDLSGSPVTGTSTDGSWDVTVTFPARTTPGVWRLTGIAVDDAQYNEHGYGLADDELPALSVRVTTAADSTAPTLTSFTVGPAKRSIAYGRSGLVYAKVGFGDDVSGVASVLVTLLRPNGVADDADNDPVVLAQTTLKTGTSRNGSVLVPVYVDAFATGIWKVASVVLDDAAGNTTTVSTAQLPGTRTTFEVSSANADTSAPTAGGYAFSPASLDTRTAGQTGSLLVAAADPDTVPAGVTSGTATLASPSGLQTTTASFTANDLVDGDPSNGTFRAGFSLPRNAESGTWTVTSVAVTDGAKHTATVTSFANTTNLAVLGRDRAPAAPPAAPAIGAASVKGTMASLAWTPPSDNGGASVARYWITVYRDGAAVDTVSASASPASVPDLPRGHDYSFTVAAENPAGIGPASARSNTVTVAAIVPGAPTIGRADLAGATSASVTWTTPVYDGGAAVTGYLVTPYLNGVAQPAVPVTGTATSTIVGDLARGRSYTFRVAATNSVGTGALSLTSTTVSVAATVPATPSAPSGTVTANSVAVRWSAVDDGGSPVEYRVTGSPGGSCTSKTTSCTVTGLTPGQAYSFAVTAGNTVGSSSPSEPSAEVVADAALLPTRLTVSTLPASVPYGTAVTVIGRSTSSDVGVAGQLVRLQYRPAGSTGAWTTSPNPVTTAADGTARLTGFVPQRSLQLRLVTAPTAKYTGSTSPARTIAVTRRMTLGSAHGTTKRNTKVSLTGRANPMRSGAVVRLQLRGKGGWRTVEQRRLTGGSYRFVVKAAKRGTYSYRVVAPADASYATSASRTAALRVR